MKERELSWEDIINQKRLSDNHSSDSLRYLVNKAKARDDEECESCEGVGGRGKRLGYVNDLEREDFWEEECKECDGTGRVKIESYIVRYDIIKRIPQSVIIMARSLEEAASLFDEFELPELKEDCEYGKISIRKETRLK